jgi:isopentenyl-diphosphate delta-isomerase
MGFKTDLKELFILYMTGLTEYELDHVMIGYSDESSYKSEVEAWKWMAIDEVKYDMQSHRNLYRLV